MAREVPTNKPADSPPKITFSGPFYRSCTAPCSTKQSSAFTSEFSFTPKQEQNRCTGLLVCKHFFIKIRPHTAVLSSQCEYVKTQAGEDLMEEAIRLHRGKLGSVFEATTRGWTEDMWPFNLTLKFNRHAEVYKWHPGILLRSMFKSQHMAKLYETAQNMSRHVGLFQK